MDIHPAASKHGVDDEDIFHAIDNAMAVADLGDGRILHLGPDRSASLLEVIVQERQGNCPLVIHAMVMRKKYETYLHTLEGDDG